MADGPLVGLPPIRVCFEGLAPLRHWEPVMAHLAARFAPLSTRGVQEMAQAANFLEVVARAPEPGSSAAPDTTADTKSAELVVLEITPPGHCTELMGETGVVSALRSAAKKGKVVLRASEVVVVRKWLVAILRAVRAALGHEASPWAATSWFHAMSRCLGFGSGNSLSARPASTKRMRGQVPSKTGGRASVANLSCCPPCAADAHARTPLTIPVSPRSLCCAVPGVSPIFPGMSINDAAPKLVVACMGRESSSESY